MNTQTLDKAFSTVARVNFLPPDQADLANYDTPLPIGYGQTNSQPWTVRKMLQWLEPQVGETVLDVGAGSGWTTALLSYLVGPKGRVVATEIIPELVEFGKTNCEKLNVNNVEFHQAGESFGYPKLAPFKRILVSAGAQLLPQDLMKQLLPGGRMVIPIGDSIFVVDKDAEGNITKTEHPGFVFVPLI